MHALKHALTGENGAGESTIGLVVAGVDQRDSDHFRKDGDTFTAKGPSSTTTDHTVDTVDTDDTVDTVDTDGVVTLGSPFVFDTTNIDKCKF